MFKIVDVAEYVDGIFVAPPLADASWTVPGVPKKVSRPVAPTWEI